MSVAQHAVREYGLRLRALWVNDLGENSWQGQFIDPRTGARLPPFVLRPDRHGQAILPGGFGKSLPTRGDWVLLLLPKP
ncbi:hypothetical protein [Nocardia panacis]|uniref:hypothetical protein n=1 Tax=Nocardia panacis TaxID=2340916 RepID=UPI0011C452F3|nr:hypothetical protein [Nocardia panacis]